MNGRDSFPLGDLARIYAKADELLAPFGCDSSTDCCHFRRTGREPYVTEVELLLIDVSLRSRGVSTPRPKRARLPVAHSEGRCPLLSDDGKCRVYESRPLGCRTYFCQGALDGRKLPRAVVRGLVQELANLSARVSPSRPAGRPLSKAFGGVPRSRGF